MESLGDKLRTARNEKGISIDQVSRDTNITTRYIEALESENFSLFPGEPYIIGFLRNYSAYLDLDAQKVISLYKALRIQETPVPVEQLIKHPPKIPKFLLPAIAAIAVIAGISWGIYSLVLYNKNKPVKNVPVARTPTEYMMEGNSMERRFYKNDSVLIQVDEDMYKLELSNLGEAVTIRTPGGTVVLDLSQESSVDLNNDGIPELRITVSDFAKNNADMGAQLHFYLMDAIAVRDAVVDTTQPVPVVASTSTVSSVTTTIIPPSPRAYPFTLQANFQGYCMFRWEILNERDRRDRTQRYFQRNEELSISAQNGIRLWTSNAQAARFQVIGGGRTVQLEVGTPGEIAVADIRWVRDENNQYRLVLIRLETGS